MDVSFKESSEQEVRRADAYTRLKAVVGQAGYFDSPADIEPYLTDWRGTVRGNADLVLCPVTTDAVATIIKICATANLGITPQGGNTSLCAGAVPLQRSVVLSLARMNRVRAIDQVASTMTVEAGCILADLQQIAATHDRLFPLSLAAEGSCQIGGNLSTNAGGTQVLRYGTAREIVLGLEVVLPDGRVLTELVGLRKDNRGYDLKQLFLGSEGTLGVITAATVKLFPSIRDRSVCLVALSSIDAVLTLFESARRALGGLISGFELLNRTGLDLVLRHIPQTSDPFEVRADWMVLIDIGDTGPSCECQQRLEELLGTALEAGVITDAVMASSESQTLHLWKLREGISEAQRLEGACIKHDVSVGLADIPSLISEASTAVLAVHSDVQLVIFGHVGDGNIHFNISQPIGEPREIFLEAAHSITNVVYNITAELGGSFSAEHGVGILKIADLVQYRSPVAVDLMRTLKKALDPSGIMNPGKVLSAE